MHRWPDLPLAAWRDTRDTLHMWTQIVGKVRMSLTPLVNHWWNVPLYVSARGLTTSAMLVGESTLEIEFDFEAHVLRIRPHGKDERLIQLAPRSVADFYAETMGVLHSMGLRPTFSTTPSEVEGAVPFDRDHEHHAYDREYVQRFWQVLTASTAVLEQFRAAFLGKCSPVHFFWGSFDLAVTRFSGRAAPLKPDADRITREAYSHEVSSVGWWPGDERLASPHYYSYAAPEPAGFRTARVKPAEAYYHQELNGFYLPYDAVRRAVDPERVLLDFCQSTYGAAADLGKWDRASLERSSSRP